MFLTIIFTLFTVFGCTGAVNSYTTNYVEDECRSNETVHYALDPRHMETSTFVLKAVKYAPYSPYRNCTILLNPPAGYGVVLSIRKIDFIEEFFYSCRDHLKVVLPLESKTFCKFIFDLQENRSFYSDGPMKLLYHSEGRRIGLYYEIGFEVTVTIVRKSYMKCTSSDNFHCSNQNCIWEDLICDGHNNCGDGSDESSNTCDVLPDVRNGVEDYVVYICVAALFIVCFGITMSYIVHRRKSLATNPAVENYNSSAIHPPYQAMHPASNFCSQNPSGTDFSRANVGEDDNGFSNPCYPGIPPPPYRP